MCIFSRPNTVFGNLIKKRSRKNGAFFRKDMVCHDHEFGWPDNPSQEKESAISLTKRSHSNTIYITCEEHDPHRIR